MDAPAAASADAGQAYEALAPQFISKALDWVFKLSGLDGKSDKTVTVFHSPNFQACSGGRVKSSYSDRTVLWLSKLR